MKKTEFYFDSRDGKTKIHAVRYEPDLPVQAAQDAVVLQPGPVAVLQPVGILRPVAVLQVIHGMAEYVERYEEFASFMTQNGFVVTGEDHLGHGKSIGENGLPGYFCENDPATVVVRDVHRLKKMTQQLYPGVPYFILGHSMGSFILRNYLYRYGKGIDGAVIMGTGMQPKALVKVSKVLAGVNRLFRKDTSRAQLINKLAFGNYNKKIENPQSPNAWLSRNTENVGKYDGDPMCGFTFTVNGFRTLFELISRIQDKNNLSQIPSELPVYMVSGSEDPVGEYEKGVKRAYDSLKAAGLKNITLKFYESDRHEILNEDDRDQIMQDILRWILEQRPADNQTK